MRWAAFTQFDTICYILSMSPANLFQSIWGNKHRKTCRFNSGNFWNTYGIIWDPMGSVPTHGRPWRVAPFKGLFQGPGKPKNAQERDFQKGGSLEHPGARGRSPPFQPFPEPSRVSLGPRKRLPLFKKIWWKSCSVCRVSETDKKWHMFTCICEGLS